MSQDVSLIDKVRNAISHQGFRKQLFNIGWVFAEKILRMVAALFVGAYVARYLGPSQYGLLNYVISVTGLYTVFADLGLETITVRELVLDESKRDTILGTAFMMKVASGVLIYAVQFIVITIADTDHDLSVLMFIIATGMFCETFKVVDYYFQAKVASKYAVWSQMIALSSVSIYRVVLVLKGAPLEWVAWSYTFDLGIYALGLIYFYARGHNFFAWRFDRVMAVRLLKQSWPIMFASLSIIVYMRINQVMIKWMINDEANGYYAAAVRLGEVWNIVSVAICSSLFPAIVKSKMQDEGLYLRRLQSLYDLMILISVGVSIPMTLLSHFLVTTLFGQAYAPAATILSIYMWSSVFVYMGVANGRWLIAENLQVFRMRALTAAAIINIVLNYVFIRVIGLEGAAIATLVSYSFSGYFCFLFSARTRPTFWQLTRSLNLFAMPKRLLSDIREFAAGK